ncbi:MAG: hypothetical protein ACXVQR_07790 [Solirubrobacteraceae bacterium]
MQRLLQIIRVEPDVEHADLVGLADLGVRQGGGELPPGLAVARRAVVPHQHRDREASRHGSRDSSCQGGGQCSDRLAESAHGQQ